jgi:hypothetical protein
MKCEKMEDHIEVIYLFIKKYNIINVDDVFKF